MIGEKEFAAIQEAAGTYKYTSLQYVDYEDCLNSDVLLNHPGAVLLIDRSKSPAMLYFAADDFAMLLPPIKQLAGPLRMHFVPHEHASQLADIGFTPWGEYIDYVNADLAQTPLDVHGEEEIEFLQPADCAQTSLVSRRCKGLSRGFEGESPEWFLEWITENRVIVVREQGEIAGFCCVSIYNGGTTLWIREIAVDPAHQGRGFGKRLMEQAVHYGVTQGALKGFLAVDTLNDKAITLYERYGFSARGTKGELQMVRQ